MKWSRGLNELLASVSEVDLGKPRWLKEAAATAAAKGHHQILQWLHDNHQSCCHFVGARQSGDTPSSEGHDVEDDLDPDGPDRTCNARALLDSLMGRNPGDLYDSWVACAAAKNGHLHILQWAKERGCRMDSYVVSQAVKGGQIEVVKWLREEAKCHVEVVEGGGHLAMLKWLREQGCPWTERTAAAAAVGRHTEVLQWLLANGCPFAQLLAMKMNSL